MHLLYWGHGINCHNWWQMHLLYWGHGMNCDNWWYTTYWVDVMVVNNKRWWCKSSQLAHIQVALYTINVVYYTRYMAHLSRGFVNSDPLTDIHLKCEKCICSQVPLYRGFIYYDITCNTATAVAENEYDFRITTDIHYLTLTGALRGVYCEDLGDNRPRCTAPRWSILCR